jgi:uncharacterized protein (TIGR00251 family)
LSLEAVNPLELRVLSPRCCALQVRVSPGASQSGVSGEWNGKLKIAVRAPAEDGRANAELIEVLARGLGLKRSALALLAGEKARIKEISIALPIDEARRRLHAHLSPE